jgi:mono/diheme cytochrome c family protein
MKNFLQVLAFSLVTIGLFAAYANFGIPRIEPAPPPVDEELDLSAMTMDDFIAVGERVFSGKGTCTLCHNEVGGRAPMLDSIAALAEERLADPNYQGSAANAEEYVYESLVDPSAYVVVGFGKAGTNDTESPMPDASTGSIGLSEAELAAVVAYLQDLAGLEVTVEIPAGAAEESAAPAAVAAAPAGPLTDPQALIAKYTCAACHVIGGAGGAVGPDLTGIGKKQDREYIRRAIMDPAADVAEGYFAGMMPPIYAGQLYAAELDLLVDYLANEQ